MAKFRISKGAHEIRDVLRLGKEYDSLAIMEIDRKSGEVICSNNEYNWLSRAPDYAFDSVARGCVATVEDIKKYVRKH